MVRGQPPVLTESSTMAPGAAPESGPFGPVTGAGWKLHVVRTSPFAHVPLKRDLPDDDRAAVLVAGADAAVAAELRGAVAHVGEAAAALAVAGADAVVGDEQDQGGR